MAWTSPTTRATGYVVLASTWNNEVVNNTAYLHGDAGQISLSDAYANLSVGGPTGSNFSGAQPGDGGYISQTGEFASFCTAAVQAFAAGAITDTVQRWSVDSNGQMVWGAGGASAVDLRIKRAAAGILAIDQNGAGKGNIRGGFQSSAPGLPATFTPDLGYMFNRVAPINVSGTLTIAAPTNPPSTDASGVIFVAIKSPVGALTVAWNAVYTGASGGPGSGAGTVYMFVWDPGTSKWILIASAAE